MVGRRELLESCGGGFGEDEITKTLRPLGSAIRPSKSPSCAYAVEGEIKRAIDRFSFRPSLFHIQKNSYSFFAACRHFLVA